MVETRFPIKIDSCSAFRLMLMKRIAMICLGVISTAVLVSSLDANSLTLAGFGGVRNEISYRVLKEAYTALGVTLSMEIYPPERALQLSDRGLVDGEIHRIAGIEMQYPNLVRVRIPINQVESVVFSKNVNFRVNGWKSLKPYSITVRKGIKLYEAQTRGLNVDYVYTTEALFRSLILDRHDICVESKIDGLVTLSKLGITTIRMLQPSISRTELYHYLHKKHIDLLPAVEHQLKKMTAQGRIKQIRDAVIFNL